MGPEDPRWDRVRSQGPDRRADPPNTGPRRRPVITSYRCTQIGEQPENGNAVRGGSTCGGAPGGFNTIVTAVLIGSTQNKNRVDSAETEGGRNNMFGSCIAAVVTDEAQVTLLIRIL